MSRILITGATGRVAGVVARELASAHDVTALARFSDPAAQERLEAFGVRCVTADMVGDLSAVPDDAEILLNFAVSFSSDWGAALAVNAEALGLIVDRLPLLERMLHCSSMGVYAASSGVHAEDDALGDSNEKMMPTYSISKIAGESMARYLARSRGIPTTIARLASPYGNHGGFPWFMLLSILQDQPVTLHTSAPCLYNLIHEDDLMASLPLLLDAADVPATVLNWGDPVATSAEDWCEEMARLVGRKLRIERSDMAPPPGRVDVARLTALGYEPTVDWSVGLRRMIEHLHPDELVSFND
jgi:UDP-glucuronate 4-epimerase